MKLHQIGAALVLLASGGAQAQGLINPTASALAVPRGIHSEPAPAPLALLPMPKLLPLPKPSEARPTPFPAPTVLGTVVTAKPKLVDITGPQTQPPAPGVKPTADYSGPQTQPPNPRLVPQVLPMPVAVMPVLVKPVVGPPVRGMPTRAAMELYDKTGRLCLDVQCIATVSATVK